MRHKHKKTREQKIIANHHHQVYSLENKKTPLNFSTPSVALNKNSYSYSYVHVLNDVVKTGLLTISIIVAQLGLFFLLKNQILKIPGIVY